MNQKPQKEVREDIEEPRTIGDPVGSDGPALGPLYVGPSEQPDRYELLDDGVLGGEGRTWRAAYRGGLNRSLVQAVKMLFPPAESADEWPTEADTRRWHDQAALLRHLQQPHVVRLHEIFTGPPPHPAGADTSDVPVVAYLLMEWVQGPTLAQHLRGQPVSSATLRSRLQYLEDVSTAVSTLHSVTRSAGNPVLHRDLTPSNCIVHEARGIVLIDISGMRLLDDGLDPLGRHTPAYAAPEVLRAPHAPRGAASDLYAVGALAVFCLTGADPRSQQSPDELRPELTTLLSAAGAPQPENASSHLVQMLDENPSKRPADVLAWSRTLTRLAAPAGTSRSVARKPLKGLPLRPRRPVTLLAAGLVVTALALWAGDVFQSDEPEGPRASAPRAQTGNTPLGPERPASAGFSPSDFHSSRGTIKSPGSKATVRNCEYINGTGYPEPGKTLMLTQHNLAESETVRYVQMVYDYENPRTAWTWRTSHYFNDNAIGKKVLIELIEVPLDDELDKAEAAVNSNDPNAYVKEDAVADRGTVLAAVTVVHVDQEHPSETCEGPGS